VLLEVRIPPSEIGFVKVGQPVQIKLSAYDYTIYGGLEGEVEWISPDALSDERAGADGSTYRALVRARRGHLKAQGKQLVVLPGMTGTVEIRTGRRSVLGFVLRPMLRTTEAFRER
jgi:adhesin transport system membrane fusion protein